MRQPLPPFPPQHHSLSPAPANLSHNPLPPWWSLCPHPRVRVLSGGSVNVIAVSTPHADAERSPSASPPQRVNDDDLLCNGTAADENDEMADVFLLEDEQPEGGEGGEEEGARPPLRRPSVLSP